MPMFLLVFLFSLCAADSHPEDPMRVETTVDDVDSYRYYGDAGKVAFQAVRIGKDEYKYRNASISRWTAMQGNDPAMVKIERLIERELGSSEELSFQLTDSESHEYLIEVVYNTNADIDYSYRELEELVPEWVNSTVNYKNYTHYAVMPVETQEKYLESQLVGQSRDYSGSASGGFSWVESVIATLVNLLPF